MNKDDIIKLLKKSREHHAWLNWTHEGHVVIIEGVSFEVIFAGQAFDSHQIVLKVDNNLYGLDYTVDSEGTPCIDSWTIDNLVPVKPVERTYISYE